MAHQTEIVVNGQTVEVTEFDHTAQEIDDGINKVNTLTGEDIPTSDTDSTSISSQLSNRVLMPVQIPADADLNTLRTPGFYWCDEATNANRPDDSGSFCLLVEKTGSWGGNGVKQTYTNYDPGSIYTRVSPTKDVWNPWKPIATATPLQEFDLPLVEGWSGWAKYSKDQFGRVLVYGLVAKSTALISGDVIGTLPEGFRPSATCPMTITSGNASDGKSFATSGYVQPSGALTLSNGTISSVYKLGNNLAFNFVFPAAS